MLKRIIRKINKILSPNYAQVQAIELARDCGVKVGDNCRFYSTNFSSEPYLIEIGNHVTIAAGVNFITHDGAVWVMRGLDEKHKEKDIFGQIKIGNNVFIGVNAIILPGIEIGDNTVIAAGAVVSRSFKGNEIIAGVPAKSVRSLEEYIMLNEKKFVESKSFSSNAKKDYLLHEIEAEQLRKK